MRRGAALALLLMASFSLRAADVRIVNVDPPGSGLNDLTPRTPVGGNAGTTLGAQRLLVALEAARVWGSLLPSDVTIRIRVSFPALPCFAWGAILASTLPSTAHADFANAPHAGTWYLQPLANRLAGYDLDPGSDDLETQVNASVGAECYLPTTFYLGFDAAPGSSVSLLNVLLHEFGHGLGFASLSDPSGAFQNGLPTIFDRFLYDDGLRKGWLEMTDAERAASARSLRQLVFTGANATAFAGGYLASRSVFRVSGPGRDPVEYAFGAAFFGPSLAAATVKGEIAAARTATGDGCAPVTNAAEVAGKVALVPRGTCAFVQMVRNAQAAGAIAAVVVDPSPGYAYMPGNDSSIAIPSVEISGPDGAAIRDVLPLAAFLGTDAVARRGTDAWGRMLLYAPDPYANGSSVSHFDSTASPHLLMQPHYGSTPDGVDATLPLFRDLGWFAGETPAATLLVPSAAHAPGKNGAFFTTDLTLANAGATAANVTIRFAGHDGDGRGGPQATRTVPPRGSLTIPDVLHTLFGEEAAWGGLVLAADAADLRVTAQTSTPAAPAGAFGQALPAFGESDFVTLFASRTFPLVRDDDAFRTNLILANADPVDARVELALLDEGGNLLGARGVDLPPLGMTQVSGVAASLAGAGARGTLVVSTTTASARIGAYASMIDAATNDPRTLLPAPAGEPVLLLPAATHAAGRNGAFYTTDLTLANRGATAASVAIGFLGHDRDGRSGPVATRVVPAHGAVTFPDVLGSLFAVEGDYGALRIVSEGGGLSASSQTSTRAPGGGTFGQALAPQAPRDLAVPGAPRLLSPLREDAAFRTNVVLANASEVPVRIELTLRSGAGATLGTRVLDLPPLGMTQIASAITELGGASAFGTNGASLLVAPSTEGAGVAAYASIIDNVTNDPRTVLP